MKLELLGIFYRTLVTREFNTAPEMYEILMFYFSKETLNDAVMSQSLILLIVLLVDMVLHLLGDLQTSNDILLLCSILSTFVYYIFLLLYVFAPTFLISTTFFLAENADLWTKTLLKSNISK